MARSSLGKGPRPLVVAREPARARLVEEMHEKAHPLHTKGLEAHPVPERDDPDFQPVCPPERHGNA